MSKYLVKIFMSPPFVFYATTFSPENQFEFDSSMRSENRNFLPKKCFQK